GYEGGLLVGVAAGDERGAQAERRARGAKGLRELPTVRRDGDVRDGEYLRGRAVVRLQTEGARLRVALGELVYAFDRSAPEGEDGLRVIADDHHVAVFDGEQVNYLGLQPVRVLILVNEYMLELLRVDARDLL